MVGGLAAEDEVSYMQEPNHLLLARVLVARSDPAPALRLLERLESFRFDADDVAFLREQRVVDDATAEWLAGYRVSGDIDGYAEGELFFPGSPICLISSEKRVSPSDPR